MKARNADRLIAVALTAIVAFAALAACGPAPASPGDADRGRQLFFEKLPLARGDTKACVDCHAVNLGERARGMGTNVAAIGLRAGDTVPGQPAEAYLRTAIVDPDAYLAGGYQDGLMFREYGKTLSEQQINDLIAYMLTLRQGQK